MALALAAAGGCVAAPQPLGVRPPAAAASPRFADAIGPARRDGAVRTLVLTSGRRVSLGSWRYEPAPGQTTARNTYRCGVEVAGQAVTVIGVGVTETVSCRRLAAAGAVSRGRIGLIYRTSSPNADSLTSVILAPERAGWTVDEAATERLSVVSPQSLAAMRRSLH